MRNVIHQIDSKNEWYALSASFTAKFGFVFVLTPENAFSWKFHFKAYRMSIDFQNSPPFEHSHKKRKDSSEPRAELAVLRIYVEKQGLLESISLYRASKCTQTKEQGSEDCLWTHIFTFLCDDYQFFFFSLPKCRIKLCFNRLQFVKETQISTVSNIELRAKLHRS